MPAAEHSATSTNQQDRDVASAVETLSAERAGLAALEEALRGRLGAALSAAVELIFRRQGRVIVTGMGKSGHVGRKIAATLASTGTASYYVHPAEASHGDLGMIHGDDVVVALSWSGETAELSDIVAYTRRFRVPLIAMTSRAESALARAADLLLILPVTPEACPNGLAPTTSTTAQMALGDAMAVCLLNRRGFSSSDFHAYHPGGKLGVRLRHVGDLMHKKEAVPAVGRHSLLSHAIVTMTAGGFGVAAVVDETGKLVGVLTDGDLRRAFDAGFIDQPVTEAMGKRPKTIRSDALAEEALGRMNREKITSLFVVEDEHPVGIIHIHDLLRAGLI